MTRWADSSSVSSPHSFSRQAGLFGLRLGCVVRLLDLIAQGRVESIRTSDGCSLPGAERFKEAIHACPVRFVFTDDLTCCATQLAYADGDRLASCLDLIRVPAQSLWVEWADGPRQEVLRTIPLLGPQPEAQAQRAGALFTSNSSGRAGEFRTFWSTREQYAYVSPVVICFDFDRIPQGRDSGDDVFGPGGASVTASLALGLNEVLEHVRFRFDAAWSAYYQERCITAEMRREVLHANLSACAFDPPMLFAFFLMLCARDALPQRVIPVDRLNRSRSRAGKPSLLEHVEVAAPLFASRPEQASAHPAGLNMERRSPRLHHVCGHIVRRGSTVFWRCPHIRGSARLGKIQSRTVRLSYGGNGRLSVPRIGL